MKALKTEIRVLIFLKHKCGIKDSSVAPFSFSFSFWWPPWLFFFVASVALFRDNTLYEHKTITLFDTHNSLNYNMMIQLNVSCQCSKITI